jgi:hypothetical protein
MAAILRMVQYPIWFAGRSPACSDLEPSARVHDHPDLSSRVFEVARPVEGQLLPGLPPVREVGRDCGLEVDLDHRPLSHRDRAGNRLPPVPERGGPGASQIGEGIDAARLGSHLASGEVREPDVLIEASEHAVDVHRVVGRDVSRHDRGNFLHRLLRLAIMRAGARQRRR